MTKTTPTKPLIAALAAQNAYNLALSIRDLEEQIADISTSTETRTILEVQEKLLFKRLSNCLASFPEAVPLYDHLIHLQNTGDLH